jgi:undecaprenyl-diphosphatase
METLLNIDTTVFYFLNSTISNQVFDCLMPIITDQHVWIPPLIILGLSLLMFGNKRARIAVILVFLAVSGSDVLCTYLVKPAVRRPRPTYTLNHVRVLVETGGIKGFPSNHAANISAAMVVLIYFYRRYKYGFVTIAVFVSLSRIYVGVHYPLDVIAGACVGSFISVMAIKLWGVIAQKVRLLTIEGSIKLKKNKTRFL